GGTGLGVDGAVRRFRQAGDVRWPSGVDGGREVAELVRRLTPEYGPWLARSPALEDVTRLSRDVADRLKEVGALDDPAGSLALKPGFLPGLLGQAAEALGAEPKRCAGEVLGAASGR